MQQLLFAPYTLGALPLQNRVVMAPMTRSRAVGNVANDLMATYYAQRAEAGLIVTEGTSPAADGLGYARMPALYEPAHADAWRGVTDAVHACGARIFVQLMHAGRVAHQENLPPGARIVAPTARAWDGKVYVDGRGDVSASIPAAMTEDDIEKALEQHVRAAALAIDAGFDGVELHGGNGYLVEQFFNSATNDRSDRWGRDVPGRVRFAVELARRVSEHIGAKRVGMRVSPYNNANGMHPEDPWVEELHELLARSLNDIGLAYMHVIDHSALGAPEVRPTVKQRIRRAFRGALILSGNYDARRAEDDLEAERADLIAFGRPFLANPRLVSKLRANESLASPDFSTFYTPGARGYIDYP